MSNAGKPNTINQSAQPAGVVSTELVGGSGAVAGPDGKLMALHQRLCELVPDADERAKLLRLPTTVDAAWTEGRMLPVLRAHERAITLLVTQLEHDSRSV